MIFKNDEDKVIESKFKCSLYVLIMILCGVYGIILFVIVLILLYLLVNYEIFVYWNDLLFIVFGMVILSLIIV